MNFALVTQEKFWNLREGCHYYISDRINHLNGDVILFFFGKLSDKELATLRAKYKLKKIYCLNSIGYTFRRYLRAALKLLGVELYNLQRPYSFTRRLKFKVNNLCISNKIDVIFCEYIWMAHIVDFVDKKIIKVIDTHDIQNKFCKNYRKINKSFKPGVSEQEEIEIYSKFNYVSAISLADKDYFERFLNNVVYLPPTYAKHKYVAVKKNKLNLCFIGGGAEFNYHAVKWFYAHVLNNTNLKANIVFNVYGKVCDAIKANAECDERVVCHGMIDNLDKMYQENHIAINPTFLIGGIKTKNLEALSYGKVVITTNQGARGIETMADGKSMFIANTGDEYCELINKFADNILLFNLIGNEIIDKFNTYFSNDYLERFLSELKN